MEKIRSNLACTVSISLTYAVGVPLKRQTTSLMITANTNNNTEAVNTPAFSFHRDGYVSTNLSATPIKYV